MAEWLRGLLRKLAETLDHLGGAPEIEVEVPEELDLEEALGMEDAAEEEDRPVLRLGGEELGIFVSCAVCAVPHELEAVCHKCGASLCSDTLNCRKSRYVPELGGYAVVCPECV